VKALLLVCMFATTAAMPLGLSSRELFSSTASRSTVSGV